jgi:hypothetical protein
VQLALRLLEPSTDGVPTPQSRAREQYSSARFHTDWPNYLGKKEYVFYTDRKLEWIFTIDKKTLLYAAFNIKF